MINIKSIKSNNKVSVIIPTYNRSDLLDRAVKSVLKQVYSNLEIIIIADNCTDNTLELLKLYNDKRVSYIILNENVGGAQARNIGIEHATGDYIGFLDDDDEWHTDKLLKQMEIFEKYDDFAMVSSNYNVIKGNKIIRKSKIKNEICLEDLYYENVIGSFSFVLTKKKYLNEILINPKLKACQDWDLWIKILENTKLKCYTLNEYLVNYHEGHVDRLTNNLSNFFKSYLLFVRSHWTSMNLRQRHYHLYKFVIYKRNKYYVSTEYLYNIKLYYKAMIYYYKSGYNQKFLKYLLFLTQFLKIWKIKKNFIFKTD